MNTDSAFIIGDSHSVCEDYAIDFTTNNKSQIVVCDGCSSSKMTDVGARLLALASIDVLNVSTENIKSNIVSLLSSRKKHYEKFSDSMFDSTLLLAYTNKEKIEVNLVGDGVVVFKTKFTGFTYVYNYEYTANYPYYLSYELDEFRKVEWGNIDQFYRMKGITFNKIILNRWEVANPEPDYIPLSFNKKDIEWIALFSDGVNSFTDENKNQISLEIIIKELTDFKSFTGQFVKRRMNKFKKDCIKKGWKHSDDLSMAVINVGS